MDEDGSRQVTGRSRDLARVALAVFLLAAGVAHLLLPDAFLAQVPAFLPARQAIVLVSGLVELGLGIALLATPTDQRPLAGMLVAAWFVLIVPGNLWQAVSGTDGFGLDTDLARWTRLAFQPVLVIWALWATAARPASRRRTGVSETS